MSANVLVVFYSRRGKTETLALAAGVGAIQARANIRLRRLADGASPEAIARDPEWSENLERMKKDYIAPREIDAQWANVVILAAPKDSTAEMEQYLESAGGLLKGKRAAVLGVFQEAAAGAGLRVVDGDCLTEDGAVALKYGRLAAEGLLAGEAGR
jgi:hypothetical protein